MAAKSNMEGFLRDEAFGAALSRHAISFQSGAMNSTSQIIPIGNYYGVNCTAGMLLPGNSGILTNSPGLNQAGTSSSSLLLDSVPGLKHDTGLAVEWSAEEQIKLEEGIHKFADEPSIMKYIKIAAMLQNKTVRDVALRCRWITRKRRKPEEHVGKKVNNRKDKLLESSSKMIVPPSSALNLAAYPVLLPHMDQNDFISGEVPAGSGKARHLLEQNAQFFDQISANLSALKLQDNIELFWRTRNNITLILNDMRELPGIMSHMPQLPVAINEELANSILPSSSQVSCWCCE
ncbi:Protein of unknown function DUF3755 [Dillenia turbinata]|uniref:Myb-like domain-containing protein n=1 Tax=Dillenia turbinata TaxID=194707 RepID=A0AAN8VD26_9MAGN